MAQFFPNSGGGSSTVAGSNKQVTYNDNGVAAGDANLIFDKTVGGLGIGATAPEHRLDLVKTAGSLQYPLKIQNKHADGALQGIGMLFRIAGTETGRGKGAIAYYSTAPSWNKGDLHILQNTASDTSVAAITDSVMVIKNDGKVGIGAAIVPTAKLDIDSDIVRLRTAKTPATAGATGNAGDICWDANYMYVCVATNTWKRVAIATW